MIFIDPTQFPPELNRLLTSRGKDLPPLVWIEERTESVTAALDGIGNQLFSSGKPAVDESMAWAVRALLCLWNGRVHESEAFTERMPAREALYVSALCARHRGQTAGYQSAFRQLAVHPIFSTLAGLTAERIPKDAEDSLLHFRGVVAEKNQWEPLAFEALRKQAKDGELSPPGERLVRVLQCLEFECLLSFCYEAAVGERSSPRVDGGTGPGPIRDKNTEKPPPTASSRKKNSRSMPLESRRRPGPRFRAGASEIPISRPALVRCPKCDAPRLYPESSRGQQVKCAKCEALFLVPTKNSISSAGFGI